MEDKELNTTNNTNTQTPEAVPTGQKPLTSSPKKGILAALLLAVLLIFAGVAWVVFSNRGQVEEVVEEVVEEETTQIPTVDTTQVESGLLDWVRSMNVNGAFYNQREECTDESTCRKLTPQEDVVSLWAEHNAAPNASLAASLQALTDTTEGSCEFLFDLANSGELSESTVENLKNACSAREVVTADAITQNEVLQNIQEIMTRDATQSAEIFQNTDVSEFLPLVNRASDNAIIATWNNKGPDNSYTPFNQALTLYLQDESLVSDSAPQLSLASLNLYNLTQQPIFLEFAEFLYNKHLILECQSLTLCADYMYLTARLRGTTEGEQYTQYYNILTQSILDSAYDGENYATKFNKNAFYTTENNITHYPTRENSLLLGTFSKN